MNELVTTRAERRKCRVIEAADSEHKDFKVLVLADQSMQQSKVYFKLAEQFDVLMIAPEEAKLARMFSHWRPNLVMVDYDSAGEELAQAAKEVLNKSDCTLLFYSTTNNLASCDDARIDYISKYSSVSIIVNSIRHYAEIYNRSQLLDQMSMSLNEQLDHNMHLISRELHDEFGGFLSSVLLKLHMIKQSMLSETVDKTKVVASIDETETLVVSAASIIKKVCVQNRQPYFENGLLSQLDTLIQTLEIEVLKEVSSSAIKLISITSPSTLFQVYRIVQEALNNVQYHSKVLDATVRFSAEANLLVVEVIDLGVGYQHSESVKNNRSFGLRGMQERAVSMNAVLSIESEKGKGTHVKLKVPTAIQRDVD